MSDAPRGGDSSSEDVAGAVEVGVALAHVGGGQKGVAQGAFT
ncbi:hypothetical protein ACW9HH_14940 [Nocardia gipuzkoensis]